MQDRVAGGRYQTASEVIREGLRLLELQERDRDEAFKALKEHLQRGAEEAERGEFVTADEVRASIDRLRQRAVVNT